MPSSLQVTTVKTTAAIAMSSPPSPSRMFCTERAEISLRGRRRGRRGAVGADRGAAGWFGAAGSRACPPPRWTAGCGGSGAAAARTASAGVGSGIGRSSAAVAPSGAGAGAAGTGAAGDGCGGGAGGPIAAFSRSAACASRTARSSARSESRWAISVRCPCSSCRICMMTRPSRPAIGPVSGKPHTPHMGASGASEAPQSGHRGAGPYTFMQFTVSIAVAWVIVGHTQTALGNSRHTTE